jgi:hypothetical protein
MDSAYIAGQGDQAAWTTGLIVDGYFGGQFVGSTSQFTNIDATPDWFEMNLSNVDRIVFRSVPVIAGQVGGFSMDYLTYTPLPEPGVSLLAFGLLGFYSLRRRRRLV